MLAPVSCEAAEQAGMGPVPFDTAFGVVPEGAAKAAAKHSTGRKYTTPDVPVTAAGFGSGCALSPAAGPRQRRSAETTTAAMTSATTTRNPPVR
jgi:hypothetical protein